jgi:hypothetical protein
MYPARVETRSEYKADEYPRRFMMENSWLEVIEIEDRWYEPGRSYFRVFADDANRYILRQEVGTGNWAWGAVRR